MPQPYWAYPVPSWGYVGPILQQLAHPLLGLHVAILHCIKLNLTWRIFWLKMRLSSNMQIYQWNILFGWANQQGMETKEQCMCMWVYTYIYIHIDLMLYLFMYLIISFYLFLHLWICIDACTSIYKHVLQQWQWTVFFWAPNQHKMEGNKHDFKQFFQNTISLN